MVDAWGLSSEQQLNDLNEMLAWWKLRRGTDPTISLPASRSDSKQPLLVVLLDDLISGASVQATVLESRSNLNETQVITALGRPAGGYMRWGFQTSANADVQWTPFIYPLVDSSLVIEGYLSALKGLTPADVAVTLGRLSTGSEGEIATHNTWRWQVTFSGQYAGMAMQKLQIDNHLTGAFVIVESKTDWQDTGEIVDVAEVIGVPFPTPLKAGARAWVQWKSRVGWCLIAAEARDFGAYGLFG